MTNLHEPRQQPFAIGTHWTLNSIILGEPREILVRVPDSYELCDHAYPVLYLLDGENAIFHSATGTVAHLSEWEDRLPEMIVVGIRNTNRTRDMLPSVVTLPSGRHVGGGTDAFLEFIAHELIPFIESTYRVGDYRLLCGTSASALTVVYEYLTQRIGFSAYSASSPTLDWDERLMFRMLKEQGSDGLPTNAPLALFCGGHDQGTIAADNQAFFETLSKLDVDKNCVSHRVYKDDGHCPFEGFRGSLVEVLKPWQLPDGSVEQGVQAVTAHFASLRATHGFNISVSAYDDVAQRLASVGMIDDALMWLQQGRASYPRSADIVFAQALCLVRGKRDAEARDLLDEAAAAGVKNDRLMQLRARVSPPSQESVA